MLSKVLSFLLTNFLFICASFANPYTKPFIIPEGSAEFAGQELDTSRFRPAFITTDSNDMLVFENYFHNGQFWTAELSKKAIIEALYINIVEFEVIPGVTAAHVQSRARFKKNSEIKLTRNGESIFINDIVLSSEAARPQGTGYNFAKGLRDNYMLAARVASGSQRVSEYGQGYSTQQYEILFNQEERMSFILNGLRRSHELGLNQFYGSLKPNCVTEQFHLINQILLSMRNIKAEPFLTMISADPVSGPTKDALKEMGILGERYANLEDEIIHQSTSIPLELPKNNDSRATPQIIPKIEGYPYSLVFLASKELQNNPNYIKAKKEAYKLFPEFINSIMGSLLTKDLNGSTPSILSVFKHLSPVLKKSLEEMAKQLGDESNEQFVLYFSPWDQNNGDEIDVLKELNVDARLPIKTFEADLNPENLNEIQAGLADALSSHSNSQSSFGAMGLALHVNLNSKDQQETEVNIQVVGHIGELNKEMDIQNDQVNIDAFAVPAASTLDRQPVAILSLSQNLKQETPALNLQFGGFGGLDYSKSSNSGKFLINSEFGDKYRARSVPSLRGSVSKKAFGIIPLTAIKAWLDIFSIDFDLNSLSVKDIDVRISSGFGLGNFKIKSGLFSNTKPDPEVSAQFIDSANAKLAEQSKVGTSAGLSLLSELLSNGDSTAVFIPKKSSASLLRCNQIL